MRTLTALCLAVLCASCSPPPAPGPGVAPVVVTIRDSTETSVPNGEYEGSVLLATRYTSADGGYSSVTVSASVPGLKIGSALIQAGNASVGPARPLLPASVGLSISTNSARTWLSTDGTVTVTSFDGGAVSLFVNAAQMRLFQTDAGMGPVDFVADVALHDVALTQQTLP